VALLALGAGLGALAGAHALPVLAPAGAGAPVVSAEGVAHRAWTVQPGDTLWVIAEQVRPEADPRATVLVLRSINGLGPQYSLQPGQVLLLPAA
jgi:nucleoid-associated protein YgaU